MTGIVINAKWHVRSVIKTQRHRPLKFIALLYDGIIIGNMLCKRKRRKAMQLVTSRLPAVTRRGKKCFPATTRSRPVCQVRPTKVQRCRPACSPVYPPAPLCSPVCLPAHTYITSVWRKFRSSTFFEWALPTRLSVWLINYSRLLSTRYNRRDARLNAYPT